MENKRLIYGVLFLFLVAAGVVLYWRANKPKKEITTFEECVAAGYGILESYPPQCIVPAGPVFTQEISPTPTRSQVDLPNPAAVYCEEQGGRLEPREREGGMDAACVFDDGSECNQWDFFRGDCQRGELFCKDLCGDQKCQEIVCQAVGCPCAESLQTCPEDCQ